MALRKFFERAAHHPWYKNTIFVIVADHTNLNKHAEYKTDLGLYSIPILFYTPDGSIKPGMRTDVIAQQIDIMPTLMHLLGYDKPYVAFGSDLLSTPPQDTWAVNYNNGIYQYLKGDYMIQFDGQNVKAAYRFKSDPLLQHNIVGKVPQQNRLETELKAIIQQYMWRMNENKLQP
jgi:phosphoglycerol transferase MdoB-like AlkP superfamily enzyme